MNKNLKTVLCLLITATIYHPPPANAIPKEGTVGATSYYPPESSAYKDSLGHRCTLNTVACNKLPIGTKVWIEGVGVRTVLDRGAKGNDYYFATRNNCDVWMDIWYPHRGMLKELGHKRHYKIISMPTQKNRDRKKK